MFQEKEMPKAIRKKLFSGFEKLKEGQCGEKLVNEGESEKPQVQKSRLGKSYGILKAMIKD